MYRIVLKYPEEEEDMAAFILNLEEDMPRADAAVSKLKLQLATLRRTGIKSVKVIHGYGSSGTGGSIRTAVRHYLRVAQNEGRVKTYCPGEYFTPFEKTGRNMVDMVPALRNDSDWGRQNDGITIVLL